MAYIKALPIELQKLAENELSEMPEKISKDLEVFRTWIEKQPHLNARLDNQFLIQFLRRCKYNLEKAKYKIHLYYTLKTRFPEFSNVTDVNCDQFREIHSYGYILKFSAFIK